MQEASGARGTQISLRAALIGEFGRRGQLATCRKVRSDGAGRGAWVGGTRGVAEVGNIKKLLWDDRQKARHVTAFEVRAHSAPQLYNRKAYHLDAVTLSTVTAVNLGIRLGVATVEWRSRRLVRDYVRAKPMRYTLHSPTCNFRPAHEINARQAPLTVLKAPHKLLARIVPIAVSRADRLLCEAPGDIPGTIAQISADLVSTRAVMPGVAHCCPQWNPHIFIALQSCSGARERGGISRESLAWL